MEDCQTGTGSSRTDEPPAVDHEAPDLGSGPGGGPAGCVATYEEEFSERVSKGSVAVPPDAWWSAELTVPMTGDQSALLLIERHGADWALGPQDAALAIPPGEADAVVTLLIGIVAQARRDGVLLDGTTGKAGTATYGIEPTGA